MANIIIFILKNQRGLLNFCVNNAAKKMSVLVLFQQEPFMDTLMQMTSQKDVCAFLSVCHNPQRSYYFLHKFVITVKNFEQARALPHKKISFESLKLNNANVDFGNIKFVTCMLFNNSVSNWGKVTHFSSFKFNQKLENFSNLTHFRATCLATIGRIVK